MFCPKCGKEDVELFKCLCKSCFIEEFRLISLPDKIEFTICVKCGSTLKRGKWKNPGLHEEEIIYHTVFDAITVDDLVENLDIGVEIITIRGSIFECIVHASGSVMGETIKQEYAVEVKKNKTICPDCSKYDSGYYEAVIQLRADERTPSKDEIETIDKIIIARIKKLSEKNMMAYITNRMVLKEGVDYYVGSYKVALNLVNSIKEVFGGVVKESPKIAGRNKSTGKDLYRIWISLRLAKFHKGDFIEYEGNLGQITGLNGKRIAFKELDSPQTSSVMWRDYDRIKIVAELEDTKNTTVTSKTPRSIQILHPETYQPIDIPIHEGISGIEIGEEVPVVEIEGNLYILKTFFNK